jgi:hypothetical protein
LAGDLDLAVIFEGVDGDLHVRVLEPELVA